MPKCVVYLRPGGRMPVQYRGRGFCPDVQGRLPAGWCESCGAEVFEERQQYCCRCKRRMEDELWK